MAILEPKSLFDCPHCGTRQEEVIDDYVVPGREGVLSKAKTDCYECNKYFSVEKTADGKFKLEKEAGVHE